MESSVQGQEFRPERSLDRAGEGGHAEQCSDAGYLLKGTQVEQLNGKIFKGQGSMLVRIHYYGNNDLLVVGASEILNILISRRGL